MTVFIMSIRKYKVPYKLHITIKKSYNPFKHLCKGCVVQIVFSYNQVKVIISY